MANVNKKLHKMIILKTVGGVSLAIFGGIGFLSATLYSIIALSEGWIPHGIIASLVAIVSLLITMKGVKVLNQPLTELEIDPRKKHHAKRRQISIFDMSQYGEGEGDLQTNQGQEQSNEANAELTQDQSNQNQLEQEQNPLPANPGELKVPPEQLDAKQSLTKTDKPADTASERDSQQLSETPAEDLPANLTQDPVAKQVKQAVNLVQASVNAVALNQPLVQSQTLETAVKASQDSATKNMTIIPFVGAQTDQKVEISRAKSEDTHTKNTSNSSSNTSSKSADSASTQVSKSNAVQNTSSMGKESVITGTKPLQLVSLLLKVVNQVVDGIKSIIHNLSSSASSAASAKAIQVPSAPPSQSASPGPS